MLTGFSYPLQIDPVTKGLRVSTEEQYIAQQIRSFIATEALERVGLPRYGLPDYLFKAYPSVGFIANDLESKLPQFIPQASFRCEASLNDAGELFITINWTYQGTEQEPLRFTFERNNGL